jgi:hypothetical protein
MFSLILEGRHALMTPLFVFGWLTFAVLTISKARRLGQLMLLVMTESQFESYNS